MAVGEIYLSAFIQVLLQQLPSGAIMAFASQEKVKSHFKKLSQNLLMIQAVLKYAEEKQLTEFIRVWLESLRNLAYDLDDILDEITTQALIQESEGIQHKNTSRVHKFIPTCSSYTPGAFTSNYRMISKIKDINDRLQNLMEQGYKFNLMDNLGGSSDRPLVGRLPSTSLVDETNVFGRDEDKEETIKLLFGDEACRENVSVIPIVGMGGIGKTTLAQLVYNDRTVKQNFDVRAWVCVSEEFDEISITKRIYESVTGISCESKELNTLQASLKEKLAKTKFLIVLDDVWNEDNGKWDLLCWPLQSGLTGSRIIVTTRNDSVASLVGSHRTAYHMKLLTDKDCLSILARYSGRSLAENLELREVGLGLAKKCKGLPLAAKIFGGLLRTKQYIQEWEYVLNSKIWDLQEECNILLVLRLSYHHLPSHLKNLFAYCSIFPKGYEFDKNELVLMWMGEGFLEGAPHGRKSKEELGVEYFNVLLSRSFFQRVSGSDSKFVMHDFMNDLAHFVAGGTCYCLDEKME